MENIGFLNRNRVVLTVKMIFFQPAASQNHNLCVQQFYNVQSYSQKMLTHGLGRAPSVVVTVTNAALSLMILRYLTNSISPCWNILLWNLHVSLKPAAEVNCISDTLRKMLSWSWKMKKSENVHRLRNVQSSAQRWTDRSSKVGTQANQTRSLWWWRRSKTKKGPELFEFSICFKRTSARKMHCRRRREKNGV